MADEINPQLLKTLRPDAGGGFNVGTEKPSYASTNPDQPGEAPAGFTASTESQAPGSFTGEVATLGGFEVQGAGAERFAPKYPEAPSGYGPTVERSSQAGVDDAESAAPPVDYMDTRPARSSQLSNYDAASARRQQEAGGAASFAQESDARQARAGGAATFAQESAARSERAADRGPGTPDSRDRDRTGAMSFEDARKLTPTERDRRGNITNKEQQRATMNSTRFDNPKNQSVLAKLQRGLGGEKVTQKQLDQAYGSGRVSLNGQSQEVAPAPAAPSGDDFTDAATSDTTNDFNQGSSFNTGGASNGSFGFSLLR